MTLPSFERNRHDLLPHEGLSGVPDTEGLLDEAAHDALDHEAIHDAIPHAGGLIALTVVEAAGSYQTTASVADMDATNLKVTFTAPASGKVLVRCTVQAYQLVSNSGNLNWGLREDSTVVAGMAQVRSGEGSGNAAQVQTTSRTFYVDGLEPGSEHTYKWAASHSANAFNHRWDAADPGYGAATMEVYAAP